MIREYIIKSISTGLLASIGNAIITLVFVPLLIINLGQEGFGTWTFLNFYIGLAGFGQLGLSKANVLILNDHKKENEREQYLGGVLVLGGLLSIFFGGAIALFSSYIVSSHPERALQFQDIGILSATGPLLLSIAILNSIFASIQEARLKIHIVNVISFIMTAANYLVAWLVTYKTGDMAAACWATLAVFLIGTITQGYIAFLGYNSPRMPSLSHLKNILRLSFGFVGLGIINLIIIPLNRYLVVSYGGGMSSHAVFDTGLKLAMAANRLLAMVGVPLFGIFSKLGNSADAIKQINRLVGKATFLVLLLYVIGILFYGIVGQMLCQILMPDTSEQLWFVSLYLLIGVCAGGVAEPSIRGLWAIKALRVCFVISLITMVVNLIIPLLGSTIPDYLLFPLAYASGVFCGSVLYITIFQVKTGPWLKKKSRT